MMLLFVLEAWNVDLLPSRNLAESSSNLRRHGVVQEHVNDEKVKLVMKAWPATRPCRPSPARRIGNNGATGGAA